MSFAERRRFAVMAAAVCLTFVTSGSSAVQELPGRFALGSITGRVLDRTTGKPLENASVSVSRYRRPGENLPPEAGAIRAMQSRGNRGRGGDIPSALLDINPGLLATVVTGADGEFRFPGLTPGDYTVAVAKEHYPTEEYGQRVFGGKGRILTVQPGETLNGVEFQLARAGMISGMVTTADGTPVARVRIQAYRKLSAEKIDGINLDAYESGSSVTDTMGRYRLDDLLPGDYYVRILPPRPQNAGRGARGVPGAGGQPIGPTGPARGPFPSPTPGEPVEINLPEFYPGSYDATLAVTIPVPAAGDINGIDFTMRRNTTALLSGKVLSPADWGNAASPTASVSLVPVSLRLEEAGSPPTVLADANGSFQFNDVIPGLYKVVAAVGAGSRKLTAIREIQIKAGSRETVNLVLQRGFDITGRLVAGKSAPSGFRVDQPTLFLTPREPFPNMGGIFVSSSKAEIAANGEFVFRDLMPGVRYRIGGNNFGGRIGTAHYGDRDVHGKEIVYENGPEKLVIEISFQFGQVEVTVMDKDKPQQDVLTLLSGRGHDGPFTSKMSDNKGHVVFYDVRPGDYELLALEDGARDSWYTEVFWDEYASLTHPVHVGTDGTVTAAVQVIKRLRGLK